MILDIVSYWKIFMVELLGQSEHHITRAGKTTTPNPFLTFFLAFGQLQGQKGVGVVGIPALVNIIDNAVNNENIATNINIGCHLPADPLPKWNHFFLRNACMKK